MLYISLTAATLLLSGAQFLASPANAQTRDSAVVPMKNDGNYEVVQVCLNGTGPYKFAFDTGTNSTLVKRQLLERLNIPTTGKVGFNSTTSTGDRQRAILDEVSVGGATVDHVESTFLESGDLVGLGKDVMGVLGENFLKHFDLLIDNRRQTLTLDRTLELAHIVEGEHLKVSRFGNTNSAWTPDRLIVELRIPSVAHETLQFIIDSGMNEFILFKTSDIVWPLSLNGKSAGMRGMMGGSRSCIAQSMTVELGSTQMRGMNVTGCLGLTRSRADADGLLPTRVFRRLFVSYREGYMIANPSIREQPSSTTAQIAMND